MLRRAIGKGLTTRPGGKVLATTLLLVVLMLPAQAGAARVAIGAYIPGASTNPGKIDAYAHVVGHRPVILNMFKSWPIAPFFGPQLSAIAQRGAVPLVTWQPAESGARDASDAYPLPQIAAGYYDDYLRASAEAAAKWGGPILVRFAPEMNGDFYPWGLGANGNTPSDFIGAWRRVVTVFREVGADNVEWVWAPNNGPLGHFRALYPGDQWVDWLGLSAFNHGGSWGWESCHHDGSGRLPRPRPPLVEADHPRRDRLRGGRWEQGGLDNAGVRPSAASLQAHPGAGVVRRRRPRRRLSRQQLEGLDQSVSQSDEVQAVPHHRRTIP